MVIVRTSVRVIHARAQAIVGIQTTIIRVPFQFDKLYHKIAQKITEITRAAV